MHADAITSAGPNDYISAADAAVIQAVHALPPPPPPPPPGLAATSLPPTAGEPPAASASTDTVSGTAELLATCQLMIDDRFDDLGTRLAGRLDDLGTRLDDLGTRLAGRLDDLGTRIDGFGARIDDLGTRLDRHASSQSGV